MRRWFIALLAMMLLAQFTWAATSRCCLGEIAERGKPLELSVAPAAAADHQPHGDATQVCEAGHCHCHHASVATGFDGEWPSTPGAAPAPPGLRCEPGESHIPDGLERPKWTRA